MALYVVNGEGDWRLHKIPTYEQGEVMRLGLCGNHVFLITNIARLTRVFSCAIYGRSASVKARENVCPNKNGVPKQASLGAANDVRVRVLYQV